MTRAALRASDVGAHSWRRALFVVITAALGSQACAVHPLTQRPRIVALSERQERIVGRAALGELQASNRFFDSGAAAELVAEIGQQLALVAPGPAFPYTFHLLDSVEVNAFALPGGIVVVTRGLLLLCNDVDELAGVLAHEIAHVAARHASTRLVWSVPTELLAGLLRATVGAVRSDWGAALGEGLAGTLLGPYQRDQERDADRFGVAVAASAGFDPLGLARALRRIEASRAARGASEPRPTATHPTMELRVELIQSLAAQMTRGPQASRVELAPALDGMVVGHDSSQAALHGEVGVLPEHEVAFTLPQGWIHLVGERGLTSVAPKGGGVLRLRARSAAQARSMQETLRAEPNLVALENVAAPEGAQLHRALLRHDETGAVSRWYWLARGEVVFELSGDWRRDDDARLAPLAERVLGSVRVASAAELAAVEILRVRLDAAREGEGWDELLARTGTAWTRDEVALYNGMTRGAPLEPGRLLKLARREPLLTPRSPSP